MSERLQIPHIRANLCCSDVCHGVRSLFSWAPEQVYQRLGIVVLVQHFNQCPHPMQQCWCSLHDQGDKAVASELVAKKAVDGEIGEAWPKLQGLEDEGSEQTVATHFSPTFFRPSPGCLGDKENVDVVCMSVLFYKCNMCFKKTRFLMNSQREMAWVLRPCIEQLSDTSMTLGTQQAVTDLNSIRRIFMAFDSDGSGLIEPPVLWLLYDSMQLS